MLNPQFCQLGESRVNRLHVIAIGTRGLNIADGIEDGLIDGISQGLGLGEFPLNKL